MDIQKLEQSADAIFEVVITEDSEPDRAGVVVKGTASQEYAKASREIEILNIQQFSRDRKKMPDAKTREGAEWAADTANERRDLLVRACTVDWFGFTENGQPMKFNEENFDRLLRVKPNLVTMISQEIENDANFTLGS